MSDRSRSDKIEFDKTIIEKIDFEKEIKVDFWRTWTDGTSWHGHGICIHKPSGSSESFKADSKQGMDGPMYGALDRLIDRLNIKNKPR